MKKTESREAVRAGRIFVHGLSCAGGREEDDGREAMKK